MCLITSEDEVDSTFTLTQCTTDGFQGSAFMDELYKWKNAFFGWERKLFILNNGFLSYSIPFRESEIECEESISLDGSTIKLHDCDDCRFDISGSDMVWFLRAESPKKKILWVNILEGLGQKRTYEDTVDDNLSKFVDGCEEKADFSENTLHRNIEQTFTITPTCEDLKRILHRLLELRENICEQLEAYQAFLDSAYSSTGSMNAKCRTFLDFEKETCIFKNQSNEILSSLTRDLNALSKRKNNLKIVTRSEDELKRHFLHTVEYFLSCKPPDLPVVYSAGL